METPTYGHRAAGFGHCSLAGCDDRALSRAYTPAYRSRSMPTNMRLRSIRPMTCQCLISPASFGTVVIGSGPCSFGEEQWSCSRIMNSRTGFGANFPFPCEWASG